MKAFWKGVADGLIIALPPAFLLIAYAGVSPWIAFVTILWVAMITTELLRRVK